MAARKPASTEFIPSDDAERIAQLAAGKALAAVPDIEEFFEPDQTDPDEIALENVLSELGSSGADAKVNVYQLDEKKNRAFVGSFLPGDFSIEQIQLQYGAGEYAVEVRKDKKWLKKTTVKIAAPRNMSASIIPQPVTGIGDTKILETMQNGFKEMGAMFANALAGLAANQPKQKSALETLQELQMMKEIIGGNAPAAPAADPLQMVELAMNLAEKIQPRQGEPGASEVIMEAIKNFGPLLANAQSQARTVQAAPVMIPAPAPVPSPGNPAESFPQHSHAEQKPAPQIQPEENDMNSLARKLYLNMLVSNAQANNDPATYANMMLDLAGEEEALKFANDPQWFEKLCAEEPRATNFRGWFDELRTTVIELTKPEIPGNDTGDATNQTP